MTNDELDLANEAMAIQTAITQALYAHKPTGVDPIACFHAQVGMLTELCFHMIEIGVFEDEAAMRAKFNEHMKTSFDAARDVKNAQGKRMS